MKSILESTPDVAGVEVEPHDPWSWHRPPTSGDREAVEWWATIEQLRDLLNHEGWQLRRFGKALVVWSEPPYNRLDRLGECIEALAAAWPAMCHQAESFPKLSHEEARGHMIGLARAHWREGFEVDWGTLYLPTDWPGPVKRNLCPIFTSALGWAGGEQ